MIVGLRCLAASFAMVVATHPAWAQDRPPWPPSRDVTVTYAITGTQARPGQPSELTIAFSAALRKMRIDIGPQGYALVDMTTHAGQMVLPQQHMVMPIPANAAGQGRTLDFASATDAVRKGADTVAGYPCTVWRMTRPGSNTPGEVCFTDDGTMLRARGGDARDGNGGMEARSVTYGAIPAANFEVPAGFSAMKAPPGATGAPPRP